MSVNSMDTVAAAAVPSPTRPLTGAEYLESLRDGREIWLYGERVEDVTTHPAFRNLKCCTKTLAKPHSH
jgi:4-hydroxyphenylacetate 3-monooxygenase